MSGMATRMSISVPDEMAEAVRRRGLSPSKLCQEAFQAALNNVSRETLITLINYDWLVRNRDASLHWKEDTVVDGDGGIALYVLSEAGLTPATREFEET
jgi:post-segregation antitoxin (ccd killing protein)